MIKILSSVSLVVKVVLEYSIGLSKKVVRILKVVLNDFNLEDNSLNTAIKYMLPASHIVGKWMRWFM